MQAQAENPVMAMVQVYQALFEEFNQIKQDLEQIKHQLTAGIQQGEETLVVEFQPQQKVRIETVRDILNVRQQDLDEYINKGLLTPVNKHNYFLIEDVMQLKKFLENAK